MKKGTSSKSVILMAFLANLFIALVKFIVAFITRSAAMLAEAVHSLADTFNQVLLLVGIKRGKRAPDSLHPFGFSGELYFWSFIVAIILFTAGAVFSIYEGIHKLLHPTPIKNIAYAFAVLLFSIAAESVAFSSAFRNVNRERGKDKIFTYLRKTKKSELIVVFLEDLAAISGLSCALVLIALEHFTHILFFDGLASILIGVILAAVAVFLGNETRSLLLGESADPELIKKISTIFETEESIDRLIHIKSLQLGPEDILIAVKAQFNDRLNTRETCNLINGIEKEIRDRHPDVKKIFIEPDIYKSNY
ncbi:MAG: cation diffusion facilitator family transporter [Candidatus Aminicenantes bacterium]|nr:cation diffusion facilitator family transporter [Candidatus Aminicenantes bacterium]